VWHAQHLRMAAMGMKTEADRLWPALFHGWVELLTLLLFLFVVFTFWGWARNRGYRPADRSSTTPWMLLLFAFAHLLVLRALHWDLYIAGTLGLALVLAGWLGGALKQTGLWIPGVLLATLMGTGHMLSAIVLAAAGGIVILLSAKRP
jgi:hypothetical protein